MNKIIVFGAGNSAGKIVRFIDRKKNIIVCHVDNDTAKQGKRMGNVKIFSPLIIADLEYDYILIASVYWRNIREQLKSSGVDVKKILCPMRPMKMSSFQRKYKDIYNLFGKMNFYYQKWYHAEQFHPDTMGILVNPYFFSRKKLHDAVKGYSGYMTGKCMDFGCGIQPYRNMLPVDQYVGVEIESGNRRKGIVYYDGHRLPFDDETFDSIISSEVFEHISNIEEIVGELWRVCKRGG